MSTMHLNAACGHSLEMCNNIIYVSSVILSKFGHTHKATVMCVKWNQNWNWLATAARDHLIKIFDIRTMKVHVCAQGSQEMKF